MIPATVTSAAERWHLGLGATAFAVGLVVAALAASGLLDRPQRLRRTSSLAVAAAAALVVAVLTGTLPWPTIVLALVALTLPAILPALRPALVKQASGSDDRTEPRGSAWVLPLHATIAFLGVWATVPDTEAPLVAGAVMIPPLLLHGLRRKPFRSLDVALVLLVLVPTAASGSAQRLVAVLGAVCCVLPVVLLGMPERTGREPIKQRWVVWLLVLHAAASVIASRVIGHATVPPAFAITGAVVAATTTAWYGASVRSVRSVEREPRPR